MNMANSQDQDQGFEYQFTGDQRGKQKVPRARRATYARANRPVVMHNGMHRRRNKRYSW